MIAAEIAVETVIMTILAIGIVICIPVSIFNMRRKWAHLPEEERRRLESRSVLEQAFGTKKQLGRTVFTIAIALVVVWFTRR